MNTVREVVISLIYSTISVGLCELLVPKNSYKNQIRLITGTVLIISMLSPLISDFGLKSIEIPHFNNNYEVSANVSRSVAYALKNELEEIVCNNGVDKAKIIIQTGKDENNSIIIDSVVILFDKKDKEVSHTIAKQVENKLNVKIQVGEL